MNIPLTWIKEYVDIPSDLKIYTDKMSMVGHMLDKTTKTETDTVVDFELRGNRADCYAILGMAREARACFGGALRVPKIYSALPSKAYSSARVTVQSPAVHRFFSCVIRNVAIAESPDWMKIRLRDYGIDPINNIVDITNYVMVETGMPLHAFDLRRLDGTELILRQAAEGEKLETFDGGEVSLHAEDVIFASEQGNPLGLVGVVGGRSSGIHDDTTDILLECAAYDQATIRKTVFRHSIHTQAGLRHTHNLHASLCDGALARAASLILEISPQRMKTTIEGVHDYYPHPDSPQIIAYHPTEVQRLGGVDVPLDEQIEILERLECTISRKKNDTLQVTPPLFRTDLVCSEDIVEEVLRIWGYEKIPPKTLSSEIPFPITPRIVEREESLRDMMRGMGIDEVVTIPFVHADTLTQIQIPNKADCIALLNPPTSDNTHLRPYLFIQQMGILYRSLAQGNKECSFYEIGTVYRKKGPDYARYPHPKHFPYAEYRHMNALFTSEDETWTYRKVKGILEKLFEEVGIGEVIFRRERMFPYQTAATIHHNKTTLGTIGIVDTAISQKVFSVPRPVLGWEIDLDLLATLPTKLPSYMPYSLYPSVTVDLSVVIPNNVSSQDLQDSILTTAGPLLRSVEIQDIYELDAHTRALLFHLVYQSQERTLEMDEIHTIQESLLQVLIHKHHAQIRGTS